ncbi:TnpV protein [Longibaculum muris]|uniref:TnpV protein n=1 Tax=Longibaculum muris TaxID=1796628 RepID=UPI003AB6ED31
MANNELSTYLEQVEKEANEMCDRLVEKYKIKWNVTEDLKEHNQMEWVQQMNNIDIVVKEIVLKELIFD